MRRIELHLKNNGTCDSVIAAIKHTDPVDYSILSPQQSDRLIINILVRDGNSQKLIDTIQGALDGQTDWRLNIIPIEASLPRLDEEDAEAEARNIQATREEIVDDVMRGAVLDRDFLVFVVLSTIVAAIGMNSGSPAAVIGAMVIAPLLGPLLAFSFASAIGDADLMLTSTRSALAGLSLGFATAFLVGLVVPINLGSAELLDRTHVGLDSVVLALASGGAAALSVARGLPTTLVGVMVAVALLPPSAAVAMYLGAGEVTLSLRAGVLLATNIICVNIASLLVFAVRGIRPRTWLERRSAKRSTQINLTVWGGLLIGITCLILLVLT